MYGKFLHKNINIDEENFKIGTELNETILTQCIENNINLIEVSKTNSINKGPYILQTLLSDKNESKIEAVTEIYKMLRPGEPPTLEIATQIFNNYFLALIDMTFLMLVE